VLARAVDRLLQVIKVGTSSLLRPEHQTLNLSNLARTCDTIKALHSEGKCGSLHLHCVASLLTAPHCRALQGYLPHAHLTWWRGYQ
jgi:hypothetical protein